MTTPDAAPRQRYQAWVEEQIDEFKSTLTRDELLDVAEQAVSRLFDSPDGQYPLTEILLCDAVDTLILERLRLPNYREWRRSSRSDTHARPLGRTSRNLRAAS